MRELGFDVSGIDASAGQVRLAARNVGQAGVVQVGSVLEIPAADASYDFLYVINVLHHLKSVDEQRQAFAELFRVLKPGGLLFVHEINTRNVLFRFYMGYVFPSLNCIDEGVERWLLPNKMGQYTTARVVDIRYFTFLPGFRPAPDRARVLARRAGARVVAAARVLGALHGGSRKRATARVMTRHQSGRDVLAAALAIEGLAVALWLIPASIHIVKWPASGPVRLALLAPTWQLLVLLAAGLILSAAAAWRGAAARLRSIAGPLLAAVALGRAVSAVAAGSAAAAARARRSAALGDCGGGHRDRPPCHHAVFRSGSRRFSGCAGAPCSS